MPSGIRPLGIAEGSSTAARNASRSPRLNASLIAWNRADSARSSSIESYKLLTQSSQGSQSPFFIRCELPASFRDFVHRRRLRQEDIIRPISASKDSRDRNTAGLELLLEPAKPGLKRKERTWRLSTCLVS